ncbi:MAG: rod shape-determining protein MreC [Nitrospirota bacterium]
MEALTLKEQRLSEVLAENRRLRALLDLKDLAPGFVAAAQVVSRGNDRWSNTFIINKGGQSGVRGNMAVITPAGLLGKVQETQGDYARVLLIDDTRFRAAVRIEGTRSEAVLAGAGIRRCVLKYLDIDTPVKEGDVIVTSGLDAMFPPGIKVGEVKSVTTNTKELFHRVVVTPFVDTRRVEEVVVVKR